ncbi:MAG: hypothetical protein AB1531_06145 [Chloroflexota bacterium]
MNNSLSKLCVIGIFLFVIFTSCAGEDQVIPTDQQMPSSTIEPTNTPAPTPELPATTQIIIDGQSDDWSDRAILLADPAGDAEPGYLDLGDGYAIVNQHALYLLIEVDDPDAPFVQLDLRLRADNRDYIISWSPGQIGGFIADVTDEYQAIGPTIKSSFFLDSSLEIRLDLRDLDSPDSINIIKVRVMIGECCEYPNWYPSDEWNPPQIPVVNEIDPPQLIGDDPMYDLAQRFSLPQGYLAERLYEPPLPDSLFLARSESGIVYHQHVGISSGISIVDTGTGTVTRILDMPEASSRIVDGPGDSIFGYFNGSIQQIFPDGSYQTWASPEDGFPLAYDRSGHLIGASGNGTEVLEFFPDGNTEVLASGFATIQDVERDADGRLFVLEWETGNLVRVDVNGNHKTLIANILSRDAFYLEFDTQGNLYVSAPTIGFAQVDPEAGGYIRNFTEIHHTCTTHLGDFVFVSPTKAVFQDPGQSKMIWFDVSTRQYGLLVGNGGANTFAADISEDGNLYVGERGCGNSSPGKIFQIAPDGTHTLYLAGDEITFVDDLAVDNEGGLFIVSGGELYYSAPGGGSPITIAQLQGMNSIDIEPASGNAWVTSNEDSFIRVYSRQGLINQFAFQSPEPASWFSLGFGNDGKLYIAGTETANINTGPFVDRWVMQVDPDTGKTEVILEIGREGCCCGLNLNADTSGRLWLIGLPDFKIWEVFPEGDPILLAQNLPIDSASAVGDGKGNVYFTSPSGIYRIFQEP